MYVFLDYSPNFHLLESGRMFLEYKQKGEVDCLSLALSSKRHVVVLQTTAKKCIKARSTCEAPLSHYFEKCVLHTLELN